MTEGYSFEMVKVLNEDGTLVEGKTVDLEDETLRDLYRKMLMARLYDERAFRLQRQGRIGTYAPYSGQEATHIGSAYLLESGDWVLSHGRDVALSFTFGKDLKSSLLYSMGHIDGSKVPDGVNIVPWAIMISPQIPQAVGTAWASKLRGEDRVTLASFGDGATSKGDFHEGLNLAALQKAPVIFLCQNNQWAISVPFAKQSASETIAQRAVAYDMPGVRVDGNDVLAVHEVMNQAIGRARNGEGPTLIEAVTYRIGPHTTSDDPTRYRSEEELKEWKEKRDPLKRYRSYLEGRELWSEAEEDETEEKFKQEIAEAVEAAEATPKTQLTDVFERVYADMTDDLVKQQEEVRYYMAMREEEK